MLAHDLGTSGNKATLFDTSGQLVASSVYSYIVNQLQNVIILKLVYRLEINFSSFFFSIFKVDSLYYVPARKS